MADRDREATNNTATTKQDGAEKDPAAVYKTSNRHNSKTWIYFSSSSSFFFACVCIHINIVHSGGAVIAGPGH